MVPSERLESSWGCEGFWYLVEILPLLFSTSGIFELISHASPCEWVMQKSSMFLREISISAIFGVILAMRSRFLVWAWRSV